MIFDMPANNPIRNLFTNIADQYDSMNRMLSLGLDISWRKNILKKVSQKCALNSDSLKILDIAAGTGDFSIALAKNFTASSVTAMDLTPAMLEIGREKSEKAGFQERIEFVEGDVNCLPFEDESFDMATCAFGFRNFPSAQKSLRETARVLKPGAPLVILEFFRPENAFAKWLLNFWLTLVSNIFARKSLKEYRYLRKSINNTHKINDFISYARDEGFDVCLKTTCFPYCTALILTKLKTGKETFSFD